MKHVKLINEMYKPATEFDDKNWPGLKIPIRTHVDDVFDNVVDIYCDENHISEKSFQMLDDAHKIIEDIFDNSPEIMIDIDRLKGKRVRFIAEYVYDKYIKKDEEVI